MHTVHQGSAFTSSMIISTKEKLVENIRLAEADVQYCLKRYENANTLVQYLYNQLVTLEQELRLVKDAENRSSSMMTKSAAPPTRTSKAIPILPPPKRKDKVLTDSTGIVKYQVYSESGLDHHNASDTVTVNARNIKDIAPFNSNNGSTAFLSEAMKKSLRNLVVMVAASDSVFCLQGD
jgi:hypothetical protein